MKHAIMLLVCLLAPLASMAARYETRANISYVSADETDAYRRERCVLDVYYPTDIKDFPTIVWFHGGGLTGGEKGIPDELKGKGVAVVAVNYRLSPRATAPAYIEDAAQAVAWAMKHIGEYGGNAKKLYVSGHSAGGYLTLMLALDKSWMAKHGANADDVTAWFPLSGQTMTHYTIRAELNLPGGVPVADHYAPVTLARADTPPIFLITGDRNTELAARYEENALMAAVLRSIGHKAVFLHELQGFDHGTMCAPGCYIMMDYIRRQERR